MKLGEFAGSQIKELMFKQEQRYPWPLGWMMSSDGVTPITLVSSNAGRPEKNVLGGSRDDLDGVCIFNARMNQIETGNVCITFTPDITKATKPYGGYQLWKLPNDWERYSYYNSFTTNKVMEIGLNGCIYLFPDIGPPTNSCGGNQNPNPPMN